MNPFYSASNSGNIMTMLQQFKSNPMQFLLQRKFNVPASMTNDPSAIMNHLLSTGQVTQQQVNNAYQMAQRFK